MLNKLPIYNISIEPEFAENNEDLGINAIAFTSNPAILVKGLAFNQNEMFFADKIKYRVVAPIMIPDKKIYRNDENGEYYVTFPEPVVEKMYSKFMKNFTNRQVFNLEHDNKDKMPAYVLESWIVDNPTQDKALSSYGIDVPKGTVMMSAQFTDKEAYNEVVENGQFGFSIEGFMGMSLSEIINKQKQETMSEQKMNTVVNEFTKDNKHYSLMSDGTFTVSDIDMTDVELADVAPQDVVSGDTKTEMADAIPADAPAPQDAPAPAGSDTYSKEEIDAKLDEIMQVIANLKAADEAEDIAEGEIPAQVMSEVKMSINDKLDAYQLFANANKRK